MPIADYIRDLKQTADLYDQPDRIGFMKVYDPTMLQRAQQSEATSFQLQQMQSNQALRENLLGVRGGKEQRHAMGGLNSLLAALRSGGTDSKGSASASSKGAAMEGYDKLFSQVEADLAGIGQTRQGEINADFDRAKGNALARLQSRGFGNSSGLASIELENTGNKNRELTRLKEAISGQRAGTCTNIGLAGLDAQRQYDMQSDQFGQQLSFGLIQQLLGGIFG